MAAAVAVFGLPLFVVNLDPAKMASGVYRTGSAALPEGATVAYLRDGKTATISLVEMGGTVTIATNGKPDAGIQMGPGEATIDESTMVLAAADSARACCRTRPASRNIGFGSGLTTHTLLGTPTGEAPGLDRDRAAHGGGCAPGLRSAYRAMCSRIRAATSFTRMPRPFSQVRASRTT